VKSVKSARNAHVCVTKATTHLAVQADACGKRVGAGTRTTTSGSRGRGGDTGSHDRSSKWAVGSTRPRRLLRL
jgi:hypothetical protein